MSTVLRLLLVAGLVVALSAIVMQPRQLRRFARQIRLVGFLYVLAILVSAAIRLTGVIHWP